MKVSVIGPGAMGCLFAARLAKSGAAVTLVDHDAARAARLRKSGITVVSDKGEYKATPTVATAAPDGQDLCIVLTKAYSTTALALPHDTPILTLQNGLGNVETLCSLVGSAFVLAGATSEGATLLGEGHTRHAAPGVTVLGAWTTCPAEPALAALGQAGFDVQGTDAPGQAIWRKVVVNAGINPVTALLDVPNGRLPEIAEARMLMRDLVTEAAKVAATEGYRFEQSLVEYTEQICRDSGPNISSMLQDVRAGKQTEIDALSGEIARRAECAGLPAPRTRVVWQLIKSLEKR